jgi:hypothetical protein
MANLVHQLVQSDLYSPGLSDDGTQFTAEVFFLSRELSDGRRFTHVDTFPGAEPWDDGEGSWGYADIRDEAREAAEARLDVVKFTDEGWIESDPAYGSEAYCRQNNC